jgi:hypothetical protein
MGRHGQTDLVIGHLGAVSPPLDSISRGGPALPPRNRNSPTRTQNFCPTKEGAPRRSALSFADKAHLFHCPSVILPAALSASGTSAPVPGTDGRDGTPAPPYPHEAPATGPRLTPPGVSQGQGACALPRILSYSPTCRRRCCTSCRCRCAPECSCHIRHKPRPRSPASWRVSAR